MTQKKLNFDSLQLVLWEDSEEGGRKVTHDEGELERNLPYSYVRTV